MWWFQDKGRIVKTFGRGWKIPISTAENLQCWLLYPPEDPLHSHHFLLGHNALSIRVKLYCIIYGIPIYHKEAYLGGLLHCTFSLSLLLSWPSKNLRYKSPPFLLSGWAPYTCPRKKAFGSGLYAPWRGAYCYGLIFLCHLRFTLVDMVDKVDKYKVDNSHCVVLHLKQ